MRGVIISGYTRYTVRMPLYRFILVSNAFIISNVILFWFLIVFFNLSWAIYAFYLGAPGFDRIWCRCDRSFQNSSHGIPLFVEIWPSPRHAAGHNAP